MECKNCGNEITEGSIQCSYCGRFLSNNPDTLGNATYNNTKNVSTPKKSFKLNIKMPSKKVIIFTLVIIILLVGVVYVINLLNKSNRSSIVCTSNEGNITLYYNDKKIIKYEVDNIAFNLSKQNEAAEKLGMDEYIKQFNEWFTSSTSGSCKINSEEIDNSNKNVIPSDAVTVGNGQYGYIDIPENWEKVDTNDNSLKYTYMNTFDVTFSIINGNSFTAKQLASSYLDINKNNDDVVGVEMTTETIGKYTEYTAYKIFAYYHKTGIYSYTYWFETADGVVHYICLEGPNEYAGIEYSDFLFIPGSYRLVD